MAGGAAEYGGGPLPRAVLAELPGMMQVCAIPFIWLWQVRLA